MRLASIGLAAIASLLVAGSVDAQPPPVQPPPAQASPPASSGAPRCTPPASPPSDDSRPAALGPKPAIPSCVDPQTMVGHCSKTVVDRYNVAISAYNAKVMARSAASQRFVESLNDWMRSARDYANCEVNILNAEPH